MTDTVTPELEALYDVPPPLTTYWNSIVRRKWLVAAGCLLGVISGYLSFRRQFPIATPILTVIEVGGDGSGVLLEPSGITKQKIENVFLPRSLLTHAIAGKYEEQRYVIKVEAGGDSPFLRLESSASVDVVAETIKSLMGDVVNEIIEDHAKLFDHRKRTLEDEQAHLERELVAIEAEEKYFPDRRERLRATSRLLEEQVAESKVLIASMRAQRASLLNAEARRGREEESLATAVLLIDNDLQANLARLGTLEERLNISLKVESEALQRTFAENKRAQVEKRTEIDRVSRTLAFIRKTDAVIPPTQGLRPSAKPLQPMVITGLALGGVIGVLAALFGAFLARAKAERMAGATLRTVR